MTHVDEINHQKSIDRIAVIGAGTMGHGITVAFATGDCPVILYDSDEKALQAARTKVRNAVSTLAEHNAHHITDAGSVLESIEYTSSLAAAVADSDLIIEAIVEDKDAKTDLFQEIEENASHDTIVATNTSSISITELGSTFEDPSRFLGTHWFHPPHIVPVVEVIKGEKTADESVHIVFEVLDRIGKSPVVVEKDIQGFIGNRIQSAMAHEAWSLLNKGIASAEDIDKTVKGTFGFRLPALGVFEKGDYSGLDIHAKVLTQLLDEIDRGTTPADSLLELVEQGHYGVKTGKGVYDWSDVDTEKTSNKRDQQLLSLLAVYQQQERSGLLRQD